jgi:Zn-dependent protease with chaperone function
VKAEVAHSKLRIAESVTTVIMASVLLFILVAGGPMGVLSSAIAMVVPLALLRRFIRGYESSNFPLICGALAFAIVVTGYILRFYIAQELEAPRVAASIADGSAPPPAQAGVAAALTPIIALFAGGAAYLVVALGSLAVIAFFTRHR